MQNLELQEIFCYRTLKNTKAMERTKDLAEAMLEFKPEEYSKSNTAY